MVDMIWLALVPMALVIGFGLGGAAAEMRRRSAAREGIARDLVDEVGRARSEVVGRLEDLVDELGRLRADVRRRAAVDRETITGSASPSGDAPPSQGALP